MTGTETGSTIRQDILAFYEQGREDGRLRDGKGLWEFRRTQDVLRRLLPPAPARVLDVGGASGVHAGWLAQDGYQVELVDPVPLHIAQASGLPGVTARLGDARALDAADGSVDVVLLLGPLYHLPEVADRVRALAEARRVVRAGGLVVAATINRFAGLHDMVQKGVYFEATDERRSLIHAVLADGLHRSSGVDFTTAYFHEPAEVLDECADAGLTVTGQYSVEGAFGWMADLAETMADPARSALLLDAMRRTESAPSLLGAGGHLLTAARRD
ncbi:class I SAM-dependent methyltransferase [Streptacidiphilus sp. PAMC 29251]